MRTCVRVLGRLVVILLLGAAGIGGYWSYQVWQERVQLHIDLAAVQQQVTAAESALTQALAEATRVRQENDRLLSEAFRERENRENAVRQLAARTEECDRLRADLRRQTAERNNAERALRAELEKTRTRVSAAERRAQTVERERDAVRRALLAEERQPGVASLKELVELTDKAPRKKAD